MAAHALFLAACLLIGSTAVVVGRYFLRWHKLPDSHLLPLHVWIVAISYDFMVAAIVLDAHDGALSALEWALYAPAVALGLPGMFIVARLQKRRLRLLKEIRELREAPASNRQR